MLASLRKFVPSVLRRWWWLVPGISGGVDYVFGITKPFLPRWWHPVVTGDVGAVLLLAAGLVVASFLAYHDLLKEATEAESSEVVHVAPGGTYIREQYVTHASPIRHSRIRTSGRLTEPPEGQGTVWGKEQIESSGPEAPRSRRRSRHDQ